MGLLNNKYKVMVKVEIERDIEVLKKRIDVKKELFIKEQEKIQENINFSHRIQLVSDVERQQYSDFLQQALELKLKKDREAEFKEQVINPNDDVITAKERLYAMREDEKKSLGEWQQEISKMRSSSTNKPTGQPSSELEEGERTH